MVENIVTIVEKRSSKQIVFVCGNEHVDEISRILQPHFQIEKQQLS
jgi:hypothetical protein